MRASCRKCVTASMADLPHPDCRRYPAAIRQSRRDLAGNCGPRRHPRKSWFTPASISIPGCRKFSSMSSGSNRRAFDLGIHGGGHGEMTGRMLAALEQVIDRGAAGSRPRAGRYEFDARRRIGSSQVGNSDRASRGGPAFVQPAYARRNQPRTDRSPQHAAAVPDRNGVVNLRREGIIDGVHNIGDVMYDGACLPQPHPGGRKFSTRWVSSSAPMVSPQCIGPKAQKAKPHSLKSWNSCAGRHAITTSYCRSTPGHASGYRSGVSISATYWRASRWAISTCTGSCDRRSRSSPIPAGCRRKPISTRFLA